MFPVKGHCEGKCGALEKKLNDGCLCKLLTVKLQMHYYTQKVAFALAAAAAVLSVLLINSISTSLCDSGFAFQSVG